MTLRLARDSRGAAATELALIAPVFFLMLSEVFNLGQMVLGRVVLDGAVQQAARGSSLESANTGAADAMVAGLVGRVLPGATVTGARKSYYDFADIARAERWSDSNNNARCDNGEAYVDENRNSLWDSDVGLSGNGGAGDVVIYSVTVDYNPLFRVPFAPNSWGRSTLQASTVRKNQPYARQNGYGSTAGTCT